MSDLITTWNGIKHNFRSLTVYERILLGRWMIFSSFIFHPISREFIRPPPARFLSSSNSMGVPKILIDNYNKIIYVPCPNLHIIYRFYWLLFPRKVFVLLKCLIINHPFRKAYIFIWRFYWKFLITENKTKRDK